MKTCYILSRSASRSPNPNDFPVMTSNDGLAEYVCYEDKLDAFSAANKDLDERYGDTSKFEMLEAGTDENSVWGVFKYNDPITNRYGQSLDVYIKVVYKFIELTVIPASANNRAVEA